MLFGLRPNYFMSFYLLSQNIAFYVELQKYSDERNKVKEEAIS
jgi:hypothetical protein